MARSSGEPCLRLAGIRDPGVAPRGKLLTLASLLRQVAGKGRASLDRPRLTLKLMRSWPPAELGALLSAILRLLAASLTTGSDGMKDLVLAVCSLQLQVQHFSHVYATTTLSLTFESACGRNWRCFTAAGRPNSTRAVWRKLLYMHLNRLNSRSISSRVPATHMP